MSCTPFTLPLGRKPTKFAEVHRWPVGKFRHQFKLATDGFEMAAQGRDQHIGAGFDLRHGILA